MNEFLREEIANILRESPLPDVLDPGIEQSLAEAKALLQVMQPHGAQANSLEARTISAALDRVNRATELLAKRGGR